MLPLINLVEDMGMKKNQYPRVEIGGTHEVLVQLKPDRPPEPTVKNLGQDGIVLVSPG